VLAAGLVLALLTALCLAQARRRPYLLVGWLWYLGTLVPAIEPRILQVGQHASADRYTYIPLVGIFLAVVWLAADVTPERWRRPVLAPAAVAVLLLCGAASWVQAGVWHDSITLWEHTLAVTPDSYVAHFDLARALEEENPPRLEEALAHFAAAVRVRPRDPNAHFQFGLAYLRHDRLRPALACFRKAAELAPGEAGYHFFQARALARLGEPEAARREEEEGERLTPPRR
jgi:Flp pilus assembly protein TadD